MRTIPWRERELYIYSSNYLNLLLFAKREHNEVFNNPIKLPLYPFLQIILVSQGELSVFILLNLPLVETKYSSTRSKGKRRKISTTIQYPIRLKYQTNIRPNPNDKNKSTSLHHPSLPREKEKSHIFPLPR